MPAKYDLAAELATLAAGVEKAAKQRDIRRWVPLPNQELFLRSQHRNRILLGGNRAGKTETGVADDVHILLRTHPYRNHLYPEKGRPVQLRCIGVDFDRGITQTFLPKFQRMLPPSALVNGSWEDSYHKGERMLYLADDSTVSFMSYEQEADKFQSVSLTHVHLDEEPPKAIYDETVLRVVDQNGTITISETPVQQMEWLEEEIIQPADEGRLTTWSVHRLNTLENTNLPPEALAELVATMGAEDQQVRLRGEYTGGTLVFPMFKRREPFVIPARDFHLTPEWRVYEGMDEGYTHPGAWEWVAVHPDGSIVVFAEEHHAKLVPKEWARRVFERRLAIMLEHGISPTTWDRMFAGTIGDPAIGQVNKQTGITTQQMYSLLNIPIATEGIVKTRTTQGQNVGLTRIRTALRDRGDGRPWLQLTDAVPGLADELRRARKPKQSIGVLENTAAAEGIRDKDNDTIDALKYVFMVAHDLRPTVDRTEREQDRDAARELHDTMSARGAVVNPWTVQDVRRQQALRSNTFGSSNSLEY